MLEVYKNPRHFPVVHALVMRVVLGLVAPKTCEPHTNGGIHADLDSVTVRAGSDEHTVLITCKYTQSSGEEHLETSEVPLN
jgi:hypothetical protein